MRLQTRIGVCLEHLEERAPRRGRVMPRTEVSDCDRPLHVAADAARPFSRHRCVSRRKCQWRPAAVVPGSGGTSPDTRDSTLDNFNVGQAGWFRRPAEVRSGGAERASR